MNEIYRDPKEGALARRIDLLRRRRDELVTMPHAIRRVAVARGARTAASLAAILTGAITLGVAASPHLAAMLARVLPGPGPAPVATCAAMGWLVAAIVYMAARAMHEHRFMVAMSRYVLPGEDVDVDLERLSHERPDDMARAMAHKLEVRSAALPVAAAAITVPAMVIYIGLAVQARGWASTSMYEDALAAHVLALFAIADAGLLAAMLMTRRSLRLPIVAPLAAMTAAIVGTLALLAFSYHDFTPAWVALGAFAIAGAAAIVVRRLKIERERIETEDPAAGSDVFTWRGFVRDTRAAIAWVRVRINRRRMRRAIGACAVLAGAFFAYRVMHARSQASAPPVTMQALAPVTVAPPQQVAAVPGQASGYTIERQANDLVIHLHFVDGKPVDISGLGEVPVGWRARVTMRTATAEPVLVTAFPGDTAVTPTSLQDGIPSTMELCDGHRHRMGLHAESLGTGTRDVDLILAATLELSACPAPQVID